MCVTGLYSIRLRSSESMLKNVLKILGPKGRHWVGNGFPVRQMFGYNDLGRELSPFLLLDYAGPHEFPASEEPRGVGAHPHRGFETVTIMYSGEVQHRDSMGRQGIIGPGDVQWMTAASGVLHEEMHSPNFSRRGGLFEVVQLWVNLPAKDKMIAPAYQSLLSADIPQAMLADGAGFLRVIAGTSAGLHGPAKVHSPVNLWDIRLEAGHSGELEVPSGHTAALFCLSGSVNIGADKTLQSAEIAVLEREGTRIKISAQETAKLLYLGGKPLEEPIWGMGPFVMATKTDLEKAYEDYEAGRFGAFD